MNNNATSPTSQPHHMASRSVDRHDICETCLQRRDVADVLVVGAGPAGLAVAHSVLQKAREGYPLRRLVIVDKSDEPGSGLAYSSVAAAETISNRPAETMSLIYGQPRHFEMWLTKHQRYNYTRYVEREIYGEYLREMLSAVNQTAWNLHIDFKLVRGEAVDLDSQTDEKNTLHRLRLEDGSCLYAKNVVLALGNSPAIQYSHLLNTPRYAPSPWPTSKLYRIPLDGTVGIIGTSSSAVDLVRVLYRHGHRGVIYMMSRNGRLPRVEGLPHHFPRTFALHTLVRELEQGKISLPESNRRLAFERRPFEPEIFNDSLTPLDRLREDIEKAENDEVRWQQPLLNAFRPIVERHWNSLLSDGWMSLQEKHRHHLAFQRETMPIENAYILESLMEKGQLMVIQGGAAIFEEKHYILGQKNRVRVEYLVEATGLEYDIANVSSRSTLLNRMLYKGSIQRDYFGGIKVGFKDLKVSPGLYAIGSLTKGTHFLVDGMDRLACHACRIADSLVGLPPSQPLQVALIVGSDLFSELIVMHVVPRLLAMGHMPFVFLLEPPDGSMYVPEAEEEYHFFEHVLLSEVIIPHYSKSPGGPAAVALTTDVVENEYGVLVQKVDDINDLDFRVRLRINCIDVGFFIGCDTEPDGRLRDAFDLYRLKPGSYTTPDHDIRQALQGGSDRFGYSLEFLGVSYNRPARSKDRDISKAACACSAMFDCHELGVELLVEAVDKVSRGQALLMPPGSQSTASQDDSYEDTNKPVQLVDVPSMLGRILAHFSTPETEQGLKKAIQDEMVYVLEPGV